MHRVGVRGLSYPEPVILTTTALKKHEGESAKVPVNKFHTKVNVEKYAKNRDKMATVTKRESEFKIVIE